MKLKTKFNQKKDKRKKGMKLRIKSNQKNDKKNNN